MDKTKNLPATVQHFDALPDSARIDLGVLEIIYGRSRATIYRHIAKGILPPPRKSAGAQNLWIVGEIRAALK